MKITFLRLAAVGILAAVFTFAGSNRASAIGINIQVGTPPPPPPGVVVRPWVRPYRGAVWIAPHYEWINGSWVWINGYYTYPPRPGGYWVKARYRHGYYYPGHWAY